MQQKNKILKNYRLSEDAVLLIEQLGERLALSNTGVIEIALRELGRREQLFLPGQKPTRKQSTGLRQASAHKEVASASA